MAKTKKVAAVGRSNGPGGLSSSTDVAAGPKPTGRSFAKVPLYEGSALKNNLDDVAKQVRTFACIPSLSIVFNNAKGVSSQPWGHLGVAKREGAPGHEILQGHGLLPFEHLE